MPTLFGAPVVMPQGDGRLVLFMLGIDTTLYSIEQTAWSNGWSSWSSHKITASEWPPAMARNGDGRLMTFIVAEVIEFIEQTAWSSGFGGPTGLGNPPPTGQPNVPTIAAGADGKLVLMASNGFLLASLEQVSWGGAWNPTWTSYNRPPADPVVGPPVMVLDSAGCLQLFVVGESGALWNLHQQSPAGAWSGWTSLGTADTGLDDRPAVSFSADGRLEVFVRGLDNQLWHIWELSVGGGWSNWVSFGNAGVGFQDHPAMAPSADGRLELFMTGLDGHLYHAWQTSASNGWHFWDNLGNGGPRLLNGPAVAPSGDRRLEVFALGADGSLWHIYQTVASNGWSNWESRGHP
jgi:hypothetical protein